MLESNHLFRSAEGFQRLEDFSPYMSCIKCFGKPIIPPLINEKLREEIPILRAAATRKEADLLKRKKGNLHLPKKVKEIYHKECLPSSNISGGFVQYGEPAQYEFSAFNSSNVIEFLSSPPVDSRSFENSMHVSMSKIPSSGICSTVHRGVIVCPNIIDWHKNNNNNATKVDAKSLRSSTIPEDFRFHLTNPDCRLCQFEHHQESLVEPGVPGENLSVEQICSVSEDEQGSFAEETEFESLPTVICGKKFSSQDTDNESSFTCLTQSTDLEKYMDCSIEYSSPDDLALTAKSQTSSQLNISSRSDDASSETLVNTESELTPCASAMAELNYYVYEESPEATDPKTEAPFSIASTLPDVHQRASSVDSYMKLVKSCASNLALRKSHSEPSPSDVSHQFSLTNNFLAPTSCAKNESKGSLKPGFDDGDSLKESHDLVKSSDANKPCDNTEDSNDDGKKVFKKRHVRTNSYTLDQPSSALIMAHADCNCKGDPLGPVSPHSCAGEKVNAIPPNPAFKKEKVNIILPPAPERDKYFPVLSSSSSTCYPESDNVTELETSTPTVTESKISVENDSGSGSCSNIINGGVNLVSVEISPEIGERGFISTSSGDVVPSNEQIVVMSSMEQSSLKSEELQSLLNKLFLDIKERQQTRIQELLEEQSKQLLQLQEELKEQDRILCAKLNLVSVPPINDEVLESKLQLSSRNANKCEAAGQISFEHLVCPNVNNFSNLNIKNACTQEILKTIPENSVDKSSKNCTIQVLKNMATVQYHSSNQETKSFSNPNFPNASDHSAFEMQCIRSVDSNSVLSSTQTQPPSRPSSSTDSDRFKSGISEDSFEKSDNIQCRISPKSTRNLESHEKSHSFDDSSDMLINVPSETSKIRRPSSGSGLKVDACSLSDSLQSNDYQPSINISSSIRNDTSEHLQNSTYTSSHKILPHVVTDTGFPLKESICKASCNCLGYASSKFNQLNSNLAMNVCPNLEVELPTDEGHDQTNFYLYPHKKNETNTNISSTYQPFSNCDIMVTNEKGNFFRNLFPCQHVNDLEHLNEPLMHTNLNGCISMALPISPDPTHFGLQEENLNYIHYGAFMHVDRNLPCENPLEAVDFNLGKKTETEDGQYLKEHQFLVQDNFNESVRDSLSLKGNVSCHDHSKNQDFKSKADSLKGPIPSTRSHSSLSRKISSKPMLSTSSKSQSDSSISQNMNRIPFDAVSTTQAHKQIVSASLAKCKQRLNKDFVKDPAVLKRFEKLPAFVKGYLTRRLFKTERVQGLIKTLQDTAVLIGKLSEELTLKGDTVSEHDVDFHRQLIVQLMTTFHSVYDIFCTISIKEKMKIISESRSLQQKKKAAAKSNDSPVPIVAEKAAASAPMKRSRLSSATIKALERKKRSTVDNRTYTIEDFKGCRPRILSSSSSKSHSSSTSRIYKSSMGLALKRKTTNARKTQHWK